MFNVKLVNIKQCEKSMKISRFLLQSPMYALYLAHCKIIENIQYELKKDKVHFFQALILVAIFFEERRVRHKDLKNVFMLRSSNLSHSLRDLEKKELIVKIRGKDDQRAQFIELTSQGRKLASKLIKRFDFLQTHFESELRISDFSYFVAETKALIDVYEAINKSS